MEIYFDGGCNPNPGRMSACIVVCRPGQTPRAYSIPDLGLGTNNVAEWAGLLWATMWAKDNGVQKAVIIGDSNLAVKQAAGLWKIKNQLLFDLFKEFEELSQGIDLEFRHVYRNFNLAGRFLENGRT